MRYYILLSILLVWTGKSIAQGPPITSDKPIMLGKGATVIKTLSEIRVGEDKTMIHAPFMLHYLPTSNSLLGLHVPFTHLAFRGSMPDENRTALGDIQLLGKYQFYRKDGKGKTLRMVLKFRETIPLMKESTFGMQYMGVFQHYTALIMGYESIKYGISNELAYNFVPGTDNDAIRYKLGFGLPLLKPAYPVKQFNLYFEYAADWLFNAGEFELLYAQGIQYAKGKMTYELSVQFPLVQTLEEDRRQYGFFLGTRRIF